MTRTIATAANRDREQKRDPARAWNDPDWAWAPYQPDARRPWNLCLAGHLYRRATFGATWDQLRRALSEGPRRTIDQLMRPDADVAAFDRTFRQYESAAADSAATDNLRAWWLRRMMQTPHPLLEKMTLFWHGHFAVSNANVKDARLMWQHVRLLREFALGSFETMLQGVIRDPAMLVGHGDAAHRKARPHEHFARIVRKLYGRLICQTGRPDDALIAPLAESFARDYDTAKLVETMLRSNLFFSPRAYRRRVKSPVDFALGIVQGLEGIVSTTRLGEDLTSLGQNLYHPPATRGWPGGRSWLNTATLLARGNLAAALVAGTDPYGESLDPAAIAEKHGHAAGPAAVRFLLDLFLGSDVHGKVRENLLEQARGKTARDDPTAWMRRAAHSIFTLPEFQLS